MIRRWLAGWVRSVALRTGRLSGLYRRLCQPMGQEWAEFVKRHGGLHSMGEGCLVQMNVSFTDPSYVRLGHNVHLSGCTLFGHDGSVNMLNRAYGTNLDSVGQVDIRDNVFVGHQAIIMPGVTIGPNAIVAAGSVVTRDVPEGVVVGGVPAKVIGQLDDYRARKAAETAALPWAHLLATRSDVMAPADDELNAARVKHFFGPRKGATTQKNSHG
jgi:acetyltransferase-like isoleucine patch superfamily enzyme